MASLSYIDVLGPIRAFSSSTSQRVAGLMLLTALACGCHSSVPPAFCDDGQGSPCPETCSAGRVDEDQDGRIDEGMGASCCDEVGSTDTRPAGMDGVCTVTRRCGADHRWGEWSPDPTPSELCNGVDDDCDGETDETFALNEGCLGSNPQGTCEAMGRPECDGDERTRCVVDFSAVAGRDDGDCDGLDDDCDGVVDEDPPCNRCPPDALAGGVPDGMACIPPGAFEMGASAPEVDGHEADTDELPRHLVTIAEPFLIDREETSAAQWMEAMGQRNPSNRGGCIGPCPVERISYFDALAYANARSIAAGLPPCYTLEDCDGDPSGGCETGDSGCYGGFTCERIIVEPSCLGFRLPTEAEWEYAARGGVSSARWTDEASESARVTELSVCGEGPTREVMVGAENAFGLRDTLGNVSEWVHDRYFEEYPVAGDDVRPPPGSVQKFMAPRQGDDDISAEFEELRVVRGGSWKVRDISMCRSATRSGVSPTTRGEWLGVRLVRRLPVPSGIR